MTVWTPTGAFGLLVLAGMPRGRCTLFVAIAECESSLDDQAVSPTGAIGLWQVEPYTATSLGFQPREMYNPDVNALAAVRLSGNGANVAAWDTCYADINRTGRYAVLSWPEPGSCAANHLAGVSVSVGTANSGGAAAPPPAGVTGTIPHTVAVLGTLTHHAMPGYGRGVRAWSGVAARTYTR